MSDLPKIDSRESLEVWLQDLPPEDAAIIAHRAAMRVAPIWFAAMRESGAHKNNLTATPILQLSLLLAVAQERPSPAIHAALTSASAAIRKTIRPFANITGVITNNASATFLVMEALGVAVSLPSANDTIKISVAIEVTDLSASAFSFSGKALSFSKVAAQAGFWRAVGADIQKLIDGEDISGLPLWKSSNLRAETWRESQPILREDTPGGEFWIDWYQRALDGRPQNWPLLHDVALIDEALWKEGGEALDARIRELRQQHAIKATGNGEKVEVNPKTGKLRLVPVTELPDDLANYVRRKIIKAVEIFDDDAGQSYRALDEDLIMLRRAVEDAENLPVELFDACSSAARRLAHRAGRGECPLPEQDALIADYRDRLRDVGADILANDPETQKVLERRAAITDNDALIEAGNRIPEAVEAVLPFLEGRLADTLPKDAATATDPDAEPKERAEASYRLSGRMLRIGKEIGNGFVIGVKGIIASGSFTKAIDAIYRWLGM